MREKNQLRISRRGFSTHLEHKKLYSKCYRAYVMQCIIKRKETFRVTVRGKYVQSFSKRMYDWYRYILDKIYRFFLIHFTPNNDKTLAKYKLIHYKVSKPIHYRIVEKTSEIVLSSFLRKNGFKIIDEHLYSNLSVYDIARC